MINDCKLTTTDNPFDPFDQFDSWLRYDTDKGYNSCNYLGRVAKISDDMSQKEELEEIERAIDEIVALNPLGIYEKRTRSIELT